MSILKRFISYYQPYRVLFFADMFCAVLVSAVDLAFPQILNFLSSNVFTQGRDVILSSIGYAGLLLLALYILKYFCQYFITSWGHIMGARMEADMRLDLFDHYQRLSFSYYDKNNTGEMMSRLVNDLFDVTELAHHGPENIFISVLKIAGSFILLLMINVKMTMLLFLVTLIMVVFSIERNFRMKAVFMDNRVKIAQVNASLQDSLAGIRVVKSFANEEVERNKFCKSNQDFLASKTRSYKMMGGYHAWNSLFTGLLYIAVIVAGGYFIAEGTLHVTELVIYILYINIYVNPLEVLINFTEQFQKGFSGFKRLTDILETQPEIIDKPDAVPLDQVRGEIEFHNVSFRYNNEDDVLHDVSIRIPAGKNIALVGPSGGGKTTLCSLLPRFYDVTAGSITIDGKDIRDLTLKSLRSAIGIVQQDVYMFSGTIKENIAFGKREATEEEIMEAARNANIHDYIMSLEEGYETFVGERGVRLSGGQKQRLAIARVFLKNPPILILDEATSALDNESERYIQQSLEKLSADRTTIVIAHRLSTIRNADEIIVITDEGIKERGTHRELISENGIYSNYYHMQFEGLESATPDYDQYR
ncbi:ABC transporter ATP-binding protein [Dehalobacterium formicoaceticum]|uniref:ABC transporter ATP-binding protein/permease n=1 Tax=Dehalobacterium formicoaceticum TaxID=51515 RepID=A0ABT1Y0H5_9FIRM|nr:ABC transporter ATP-binding protein [Dehalobacterium formicoaceticum]MCR6544368.1 ABC transporter ATP-binding protein/permease [Dehalobacterium formicoaceticum]